jgi:hypothetical protein
MGFLPEQEVGVVLLSNATRNMDEMGIRLLDVLALRAQEQ